MDFYIVIVTFRAQRGDMLSHADYGTNAEK